MVKLPPGPEQIACTCALQEAEKVSNMHHGPRHAAREHSTASSL